MRWLKNVVVDIAATILVLVTVFGEIEWAYWLLAVYTGFMVIVKIIGLLGPAVKVKKDAETPPDWFYHVLYAINVAALAYGKYWMLAGGWGLIWILSIIYKRRRG